MRFLTFVRKESWFLRGGVALVSALLLTGGLSSCTPKDSSSQLTTSSLPGSGVSASLRETAEAGKAWEADSGNVAKGFVYVRGLLALDQDARAVEVLQALAAKNPDNPVVNAYFGKVLLHLERFSEGEVYLRKVVDAGHGDWKVYSALGSALDQQGRYGEARDFYNKALAEKPDEPMVLNNLAMSYALEGDLKKAEEVLRKALSGKGGEMDSRLRQNLALVLGLQGRFDEAKEIASQDLPPATVAANEQYLRSLLSKPQPLSRLKTQGGALDLSSDHGVKSQEVKKARPPAPDVR